MAGPPADRITNASLARKPAAVDGERETVQIVGGGRREEDDGAGEVLGRAPAAGRNPVEDRAVAVGVGPEREAMVLK